ncbi:MAG: SHOCT domain-containing protein [Armatimonadetes bacterium]|nr:SHOCT domain-containing protein [Anaerolineae bacterium]
MSNLYSDDEQPKRKNTSLDPQTQAAFEDLNTQLGAMGIDLKQMMGAGQPVRQRRGIGCGCLFWAVFTLLTVLVPLGIALGAFELGPFEQFNAAISERISPIFCSEGRSLISVEGRRDFDGTEILLYCADSDGEYDPADEVTGPVVLSILGVIGVVVVGFILITFLFSVIVGIRRVTPVMSMARNMQTVMVNQAQDAQGTVSMTTIDLRGARQRDGVASQMMLDVPSVRDATTSGISSNDLTDRLHQLKEAYEAGLITREEYDRKRQALLNEF